MDADGRIVLAGSPHMALARYTESGLLDAGFGGGLVQFDAGGSADGAVALALQPDGRIVAAGVGDACDNRPPDVSGAAPSVALPWPANHRFIAVAITGVTDPDGDPVAIRLTQVFQDEPVDGDADGETKPDAAELGRAGDRIRAERSGKGDGRVYTIQFEARDDQGGVAARCTMRR